MPELVLPALYAMFIWWFTTGLIVWLDGLPASTYRWSMAGSTLLGLAALYALYRTAGDTSVAGAYCAFTSAVLVWGWIEVAFLMGFVTGPRREPSPPDATDLQRFGHAVAAILHHELFILVAGLAVVALTWDAPNQAGTWTFMILWAMRLSAKLNLFLGVRNRGEDFLPEKMRHIDSYFARRPINLLFPVAVTASTALAAVLWAHAAMPHTSAFDVAKNVLAATLLSLAILEHWFMVLPLSSTALWKWAMRSRRKSDARSPGAMESVELVNLPLKTAD
jgi:putative photosynthetic complex assembly protein 2